MKPDKPARNFRNKLAKTLGMLRYYKFQSIFFRYFRSVFSIILVIVSLFLVITYYMYDFSRKAEITLLIEKNFMQSANTLDLINQTIERDYLSVRSNEDILLLTGFSREYLEYKQRMTTAYSDEAVNGLALLKAGNRLYDTIYYYCPKNGYIIAWNQFIDESLFVDTDWIRYYHEYGDSEWYRIEPVGNRKTISIVKGIIVNSVLQGILVFNIDYSYMDMIMKMNKNDAIVAENGMIVMSDNEQLTGRQVRDFAGLSELYRMKTDSAEKYSIHTRRNTINMAYATSGKYTYLSQVEIKEFGNIKGSLFGILILGMSTSVLLAIVLSLFMAYNSYGNILNIISAFQASAEENGKLAEDKDGGSPEVRFIKANILKAVSQSASIEKAFQVKLQELKKAQSIALQTQINPHFLLNTLQIISFSIARETPKNKQATHIISIFSDIIRNLLDTRNYLIDLKTEISIAKKFLEIENIRYQGMFQTRWDIDPQTEDYIIPKCTLQPILENCIKHGLKYCPKKQKEINITVQAEPQGLVIIIRDNGLGMDAQTLRVLKARMAEPYLPESQHIGLCNVNMRISLIYGGLGELTVDSEAGIGTTVTLRIPAIHRYDLVDLAATERTDRQE
ncbi:MAG TPA: hypothetical protein DD640_08285 [Clostridiales bacterium]|nr:hypothetical protein [Clostridiales bacterium]